MLHTKIVDFKKDKILTSNAEKFIKDSKFGASIYFLGTVRNVNDNKTVTGITYDSPSGRRGMSNLKPGSRLEGSKMSGA